MLPLRRTALLEKGYKRKTEKVATTVNIYSERARKEITTNFRFNKAYTYHNIKKIQKNEIVISCLALFYKTFFFPLHFLAMCSLVAFSYDNKDVVISFSMEQIER